MLKLSQYYKQRKSCDEKKLDKISINTNWSVKRHPRASQAEQSGPQDGKRQSCITVE